MNIALRKLASLLPDRRINRLRSGIFASPRSDVRASTKSLGALMILAAAASGSFSSQNAAAETITSALVRAYDTNPELNRDRASVRVQDEDVAKAWSGMRPSAGLQGNVGPQTSDLKFPIPDLRVPFIWTTPIAPVSPINGKRLAVQQAITGLPRGGSFNVSQTLFDGGRTKNAVGQAEAGVFAARAMAEFSEQMTLQSGAAAYMNVLRDTAILSLRKNNVSNLELQLYQTQQRLRVGEVTNTDVSQAEAALAQARSEYSAAQAQLRNSIADYHQIIGVDPGRLEPASSIERLLPASLEEAIDVAIQEHPSVRAAMSQMDAAEFAVHAAESALAPTLSLDAQVQQQDDWFGFHDARLFAADVRASLKVPLYQRGQEYASIRQEKEKLGRARLELDVQRGKVRANVVTTYGRLQAAKAQIKSDQATVKAAEKALDGVRREAQAGQRTTLDVLNAHQALLNARTNLLISQSDRVIASYMALAAIGRLSAENLKLDVIPHDPTLHFEEVKFKSFGVDAGIR
jgi:outer membrane protein